MLPIAPSTFYAHAAIARDPHLASDRSKQDAIDRKKIKEAFDGSGKRYGARKIWHDLRRDGHDIARCTVERLMKAMEIQGVVRGQRPITTNPDTSQPCPDDKVNRDFTASMPNQLWGRSLWRHWFEPNGRRLLAAVAERDLGLDPHSGVIVVFRAKRGDRIKVLLWDGSGMGMAYKRLEQGKFAWPKISHGVMRLSRAQFEALFEGLDWRRVMARRVARLGAAE